MEELTYISTVAYALRTRSEMSFSSTLDKQLNSVSVNKPLYYDRKVVCLGKLSIFLVKP